jgi:hypothetical protein
MDAGTGEKWLIALTKRLRFLLPDKIITHTVQGPYFCGRIYKNGGFETVNK